MLWSKLVARGCTPSLTRKSKFRLTESNQMATATDTPKILDGYLSESQLAGELNKNIRTLKRWHELRVGPARTFIGRAIFYRRDSVLAWLAGKEQRKTRTSKRVRSGGPAVARRAAGAS